MKHKHCELIKAWADGAEIESRVLDINGEWSKWESELNPSWHTSIKIEYRIKPERVSELKPLSDEEIVNLLKNVNLFDMKAVVRAIEERHGIK